MGVPRQQSLALLYALGKTLKEKELVEQFCKACNGSWGKKADENYFHELVSLAFVEVREESRSKYRKILQYADFRQWDAKQFSDVLNKEDKGIEKLYKDAVQALNHSYDAEYNEASNEQYQRARNSLKQQRLCSPIKINIKGQHPVSVDGYSTAIVRLKGNSLEIVDFATGQTEDLLKRAVVNLVGSEPRGLRKKLKEKNLYWLYTFTDVFSRFIPTQKETESELAHKPGDQSILDLVEEFKTDPKNAQKLLDGNRRREAKDRIKADLQRFDYRIALKLEVCGGGWVGETISTLPSAPSVCFKFKDFDKVFDQTKILAIHGLSAKALKEDFLHRDEWQLQPNLDGYRLRPATKDDKKAQIQLFDPTPEWHGPLRQMSVRCSFEMTSKHIVDLNHWRSDRGNIKSFTRPKPFPKYLELESDNGRLVLVFPTDKTQRLEFGQLVKTKIMQSSQACIWDHDMFQPNKLKP